MRNWTQVVFFFFKQKTAYEVRISDWSSDVCSSDLIFSLYFNCLTPDSKSPRHCGAALPGKSCRPRGKDFRLLQRWRAAVPYESTADESARGVSAAAIPRERRRLPGTPACEGGRRDRNSVVWGKSVSVRVNIGGSRKQKTKISKNTNTRSKHYQT